MKSILMSVTIGSVVGLSMVKLIKLDIKSNCEKSREESIKMLKDYGYSEKEIDKIIEGVERELRITLNCLIFFFLFILFLIAKFL